MIDTKRFSQLATAFALVAGLVGLYSLGLHAKLIFDDAWIRIDAQRLVAPVSLQLDFRSLFWASFQIVHQYIGQDLVWQRAFNVFLHITNTLLLWRLTAVLMGKALSEQAARQQNNPGSVFTAMLQHKSLLHTAVPVAVIAWAFNPVAVYAVQYLIQRTTLLATMFLLVSWLTFIGAFQAQTSVRKLALWVIMGAAYVLAVMSKQHAAPGIAILLPIFVFWRRPSRCDLAVVGSILVGAIALAAAWTVYKGGWALGTFTEPLVGPFLQQLEVLQPGAGQQVYALSVVNQLWLFFRYGIHWLLPWVGWLSIDIRPTFPLSAHAFPHVLGAVLFCVAVSASVWVVARQRGIASLAGLAFLVPATLFTTELAFVRLQEPFVLYRSYLWSVSLPVFWALALLAVFSQRKWLYAAGLGLAVGFGLQAHDRIKSMRDDPTVWQDALAKTNTNAPVNAMGRWRAPHNLARWDLTEGRYQDALAHARLADQLGAPDGLAKSKMGFALVALRRPQEALPLLIAAKTEGFLNPELWIAIGSALDQMNRVDEAFEAYDRALSSNLSIDYRPRALLAAGYLANRTAQYKKAEGYFSELHRIQPTAPDAIVGLGLSKVKQGAAKEALDIVTQAIARKPHAELFFFRAQVNFHLHNQKSANEDVLAALARDPRNLEYIGFKDHIQTSLRK